MIASKTEAARKIGKDIRAMNRPRSTMLVVVLLGLACYAVACGDGTTEPLPRPPTDPPRATAVTVTPSTASLVALGDTVRLSARVQDQNGQATSGAAVTWTSSDASVAAVDGSGLVTAAGNGTATVTATSGAASGSGVVTVDQEVTAVAVTPSNGMIETGDTLRLAAEALDANEHPVAGAEFAWSSSDVSLASVDASGLVRGVAPGAATITAASGSAEGTAEITIGENPDRAALVALYNATDGPNWRENTNWLTDAPLGDWYGVEADAAGRVVELDLAGTFNWDPQTRTGTEERFGLRGPIPPELGKLAHLRTLDLSYNYLTRIPPEIGHLSRLEHLRLDRNHLYGAIPEALRELGGLRSLDLSYNQMTGEIPPWLGNLVNLQTLDLGNSQLSGAIPAELGNLSNLQILSLTGLSGPIPPELERLRTLRELNLSGRGLNNETLTGPIPAELGNLVNLTLLNLTANALTGPVPPELGNLSALRGLYLYRTHLSGPLPSSLLQVPLRALWYNEANDLCVPGTQAFLEWIEGMDDARGPFCNDSDRSGLEDLFELAGGSGWTDSDGWLGSPALAQWSGVSADSLGRVTALDLSDNGLAGRLPHSLGFLSRMADLRLGGNSALSGLLPVSLQNLPLRALHYRGTGLCAPQDESFAAFLNAVPSHEGTGGECVLSDKDLLVALYEETGGQDWNRSQNWLTDAPLSQWEGVSTDGQGRVSGLYLSWNNLNGRLSPAIGRLVNLVHLDIGGNEHLTGGLPPDIGALSSLTRLSVAGCGFQGSIPPEIGGLQNLRVLNLSAPGLTGDIPAEIGGLAKLEELIIGGEVSGVIPPEIGRLSNLKRLEIRATGLTGPIPASFGNLVSIEVVDLRENFLSGPIPAEMGHLAKLDTLNLNANSLTGAVPPELGRLSSLTFLGAAGNRVSGELPEELGGLTRVEHLNFTGNDLSGTIPSQFGSLSSLRDLLLGANAQMSGSLPTALVNLSALQRLDAGGTDLCAPTEASFLEWLAAVPSQRVRVCDNEPTSAYLVQAVQSRGFPVPLVAGEAAFLRVFPTAGPTNQAAFPPAKAMFFLNGEQVHTVEISGKPGPIPTSVSEGSLDSSLNAFVPADVVRPGLEMVVEIDPDGMLAERLGVARRIPDTGRLAIDVRNVPLFELTLVPFLWAQDPDSSILAPIVAMADDPENHGLLEDTRTLLPVESLSVRAHEPVMTSGPRFRAILSQTEAIRVMEGGTGHYMGMMSPKSLGYDGGGQAYLGGWSSFSAMESPTIAHELGHNMSLEHAPCGGVTGIDPTFPYPNGNIGVWGYDHDRDAVVLPGRPDLMSYCGPPDWISDYYFSQALRFRNLQEDRHLSSAGGEPSKRLMIWGGLDADGVPYLEPAFVVNARAALPDSVGDWRLTGRSTDGRELFSLDFAMPEVADGDGLSYFVFALPAPSRWAGDLADITLSGPRGSFTLDGASDLPMTILRDSRTGRVRGFLREPPLAARAAMNAALDAAESPGVETLYSRGIPDANAWRR